MFVMMPDPLTERPVGELVKATPEQGTFTKVGHPLFITLDTRFAKTALSLFDSFFFSLLHQLLLSPRLLSSPLSSLTRSLSPCDLWLLVFGQGEKAFRVFSLLNSVLKKFLHVLFPRNR